MLPRTNTSQAALYSEIIEASHRKRVYICEWMPVHQTLLSRLQHTNFLPILLPASTTKPIHKRHPIRVHHQVNMKITMITSTLALFAIAVLAAPAPQSGALVCPSGQALTCCTPGLLGQCNEQRKHRSNQISQCSSLPMLLLPREFKLTWYCSTNLLPKWRNLEML